MTLTDAERQFIEIMRDHDAREDLSVEVKTASGAWDISMSAVVNGKRLTIRGTGRTFGDAWDNAAPTWA